MTLLHRVGLRQAFRRPVASGGVLRLFFEFYTVRPICQDGGMREKYSCVFLGFDKAEWSAH